MLEYIFKNDNPGVFWQAWESLIKELKAGPRYLKTTIDSHISIWKYRKTFFDDQSFVLLKDKKPVAAVFLPIEKNEGVISMSVGGGPIIFPLLADNSLGKELFEKIHEIAREKKVQKITFFFDPVNPPKYNHLQKYGYLDASILNYRIGLEENDLLKACRRGHKCDIKKILDDKEFEIICFDKENADLDAAERYRLLHEKCAGKVTRPKETFDWQLENIKNGQAALFGLKYKGKEVAFNFFEFNFDKGLYFSGVDDPEYANLPLYHVLIFSAMEYLKKRGVKWIDTDQPSSPSCQFGYYPDQKQLNIALFKRGFPGEFVPNFRGIKYFDRQILEKDLKKMSENLKQCIEIKK